MEYAKRIEWLPEWSAGTPLPRVLSNGSYTYLIYLTDANDHAVIASFKDSHSHRFGIVNDEAAMGHPLYAKGLEIYQAHIIEHSEWLAELITMHQEHPQFSEKFWVGYKHYLLFFHDQIFEIIAKGFHIECSKLSIDLATVETSRRLHEE